MAKEKGPNKRLEREPDYNRKRRSGSHAPHFATCTTCGFPIPELMDVEAGQLVPCSESHIRCVRCQWPVAKDHITDTGLCVMCMGAEERRKYYRRTQQKALAMDDEM